MEVRFKRTGARRYAVIVVVPGQPEQAMDPAPGYDDDIPHDLVHYVVEAELGLGSGVYGRAAQGGGTFIRAARAEDGKRARARQRRKQHKRESALKAQDGEGEMALSERLAALSDVAWRRQHGQRADPLRKPPALASSEDAERVARVVVRLDALAALWRGLPVGDALTFVWPRVRPEP